MDDSFEISFNGSSIAFDTSEESIRERDTSDRQTVIDKLMTLYLRHNLTEIAVEDVAKLINTIPGAKVNIPLTKYSLFNEFMAGSRHKVDKYIHCSSCNEYTQFNFHVKKESKCDSCNKNVDLSAKFFVHLHAEQQLRTVIRRKFRRDYELQKKGSE